jgi:hypothetical protein
VVLDTADIGRWIKGEAGIELLRAANRLQGSSCSTKWRPEKRPETFMSLAQACHGSGVEGVVINLFGPDTLSKLVGASFCPPIGWWTTPAVRRPHDGAYPKAAPCLPLNGCTRSRASFRNPDYTLPHIESHGPEP